MAQIETIRGPVDDAFLDLTTERVDDAKMFATLLTYRFKGDGVLAAQFVRPIWTKDAHGRDQYLKINEFDRVVDPEEMVLIEIDGVRSMRRAGDMEHRFGQIDNENEYTTWEEFWLPGVGVPVHREPHVRAKKAAVEATGGVGNVR